MKSFSGPKPFQLYRLYQAAKIIGTMTNPMNSTSAGPSGAGCGRGGGGRTGCFRDIRLGRPLASPRAGSALGARHQWPELLLTELMMVELVPVPAKKPAIALSSAWPGSVGKA